MPGLRLWLPLVMILAAALPTAVPAQAREIHIEATMFAFDPPRIRVQRGDQVTLVLHSMDVVHGLYLDGYDIELSAAPGQSARVTFVADRPGKFRYRCSVTCGALHPFMVGELIVAPNSVWTLATAISVAAAAGTLLALYLRSRSGEAA